MRRPALVVLAFVTLALPGALAGQVARPWQVGLTAEAQHFATSVPVWTDWWRIAATARRRFHGGTLVLEASDHRRFGEWDGAFTMDGYLDLWARAYGNLRLQAAPDALVIPRVDVAAELFQGFHGWEASAGLRRMMFRQDDVDLLDVSLARYLGPWYLQARGTAVPGSGGEPWVFSVLGRARRYLREPDDLLELTAGSGREVVVLGEGTFDLRTTRTLAARAQLFPWARTGFGLGASYTTYQGIPHRTGLTLSVMRQF